MNDTVRKYGLFALQKTESKRNGYVTEKKKAHEVSTKWFILLHVSLIFNSLAGAAAKMSGKYDFFSIRGLFFFGLEGVIMLGFAVIWQQVLKHMSLNFAFINKPIAVIYPLIWGTLFFNEHVTPRMVVGALVILVGIAIGVSGNEQD